MRIFCTGRITSDTVPSGKPGPRCCGANAARPHYAIHLWDPGKATVSQLVAGLDAFFADHNFLEMGRKRPYPHESWYQTSGYYYYFDHYYAARLLADLPENLRSHYAAMLTEVIVPHQEEDGSWWDYAMWDYHKPYGTSFAIMTLLRCRTAI